MGCLIIFALSSSYLNFQYAKVFAVKLWQPWEFSNISATSDLVSDKLVSHEKEKKRVYFVNDGWYINTAWKVSKYGVISGFI